MNDEVRVEIERYLDGGMAPEEASVFLASLRRDPEALAFLGHALEDQAHLFDAVRSSAPRRARRPRALTPPPSALPLLWIAGLAAAGVFALLLGVTTSGPKPSPRPSVPPREEVAVAPEPVPAPPPPPPRKSEPAPVVPPPPPPRVEPAREVKPPPPPEPPPTTPEPAPSRESAKPTLVAIAVVEKAEGDCSLKPGASLFSGQGVRCGTKSSAMLKFPDGTRVELGAASLLRDASQGPGGKRLRLDVGTLAADVPRQPAPFVVTTPQAEVIVLGTRFSIVCTPEATSVEVREGRVKAVRPSDGAAAEIPAEHAATISAKGPVEAKPLGLDEVQPLIAQGRIQGLDWQFVKDPDAATGVALEAPRSRAPALEAPHVVLTVNADAGKTYHVWVRGRCLPPSKTIDRDAVFLEFVDADVIEPPGVNKGKAGHPERGLFNGFIHHSGYGWVGSDSDRSRDVPSVTVRFARPGRQTIKMYAYEGPVRIDAIWLSATQKTRPDDAVSGPPKSR